MFIELSKISRENEWKLNRDTREKKKRLKITILMNTSRLRIRPEIGQEQYAFVQDVRNKMQFSSSEFSQKK